MNEFIILTALSVNYVLVDDFAAIVASSGPDTLLTKLLNLPSVFSLLHAKTLNLMTYIISTR